MTFFNSLNREAFDIDPIQEFRRVAGGLPDAPKKYKDISSRDKKRLLWNFFASDFKTEDMLDAKTAYSGNEKGATIRELIDEMNDGDGKFIHSIEHVVPKSSYEDTLDERLGNQKSNGASVNPLNFLPSHSTVNSKRGTRFFDFNGDTVESETLAKVDGDARIFQAGADETGEWVVPLVTRGDIARCVMYMEMMYELNYVNEKEMKKLQEWMKEDDPSDYERAFGLWLRETKPLEMNVQNPFVSNPELVTDGMFQTLLNSYLKKNVTSNRTIVIDSVLPNPTGLDVSGEEIITLRNTTANAVDLKGWTLRIVTQNSDESFFLEGSLVNGQNTDFAFNRNNALSNSRQTTITLRDASNNVVSDFQYSSKDARPGRVLSGSP